MKTRTKRRRVTERECHRVAVLARLGASNREIARETGLNRNTVARIRRGYRPPERLPAVASAPPARCSECGDFVSMPCVRCQAVAYLREKGGAV